MASITDGQVVWICVANVGLLALSNSRSLLGRMDHLQQTKGDMYGLSHVFIEDRRARVQQKTPDACRPVFKVLRGLARRAGGPPGTWTASGPPRGHVPTSFSRSSARCRVFS